MDLKVAGSSNSYSGKFWIVGLGVGFAKLIAFRLLISVATSSVLFNDAVSC
jgi:hypothetical protein